MKRTVQRFRLYLAGIALLVGGSIAWASTAGPNIWAEKLQSLLDESNSSLLNFAESSEELAGHFAYVADENNPLIREGWQFSSQYSQNDFGYADGGNLSDGVLIDGDASTFWHSVWSNGNVAGGTHYIQVEITDDIDPQELLVFVFTRRSSENDHTTKWTIMGTNNPDAAKKECEELAIIKTPFNASGETLTSDAFARSQYQYLRFYSDEQAGSYHETRGYFHLAEFQIYPAISTWIPDVNVISVTMAKGDGSSFDDTLVNEKASIKVGTSSKTGSAHIIVPAGVKMVTFKAVAWKGIESLDLSITNSTDATTQTFTIYGNEGLAGTSPYTIEEAEDMIITYEFANKTTDEVTLDIAADKRFIIWDAVGYADNVDDGQEEVVTRPLATGEYYFKVAYDSDNDGVEETYFLGGANSWGTRAALIPNSVLWNLENIDGNIYHLDSYQSNGGTNHYLGNNAFIDAAACNIYFNLNENDGTYTLSLEEGANYLYVAEMGFHNLPALSWGGEAGDAVKFNIVSTSATIQPGDNVTFLIRNANFDTNNRWGGHREYDQAWTVEANNQYLRGGEAPNTCAESWHSAFNIYQTLTNVPNGVYEMTVQAAMRDDSEAAQAAYNAGAETFAIADAPVAYINNATAAFIEMENVKYENYTIYRWSGDSYTSTFTPAISGSANMYNFSQMFAEGKYKLTVQALVADNTITLGVKGTRSDMWAIFDNFTLTYLGIDDDFQQQLLETMLTKLQTLHAEAQELAADERLSEDMAAMLQDAIAGTSEVENTLDAYEEAVAVMEDAVNAAKEFIASIPVIDDNHAYIFSCERSSLGIRGTALVAASYAYTSAPTAFAVINYESQNYLYSVEDRKFVKLTDDGAVAVLSNYDPQPVEISRWPDRRLQLMFNGLTFNVNGNGLYGYVINSWNNEDSGNAFTVEEVADFDPSEALAILKAAEQTPEAETTALTDVAQLSNNKVYSISGIRSKVWGVSRFGTVSPNPQYFPDEETEQFAILQDDGFYYLYSISAQQFLTADKTGASVNQDFVLSDTPMPVEISSTGNEDYPFYFTFGEGWVVNFNGNSYMNHFVINSWSAMDDGNRYAISEVGDFEPSAKILASFNLASGDYVLQNVGSGLFLGAGNNWGTQASLIPSSQAHTIHLLEDGKYAIEGQVNNGGTSYWLGNDLYLDSYNPMTLTATKVGEQTFTLEYEGAFLGYNHQDTRVSMIEDPISSDVQWRIVSTATALSEATQDNPVNATFLIKDADFDRNNRWGGGYASDLGQAWTMVANNQNLCGGSNENRCAESWHSTFELTQTIVNAPRGLYKLTAQGFYRNDSEGSLRERPVLFANDISARFPEIKDTLLNGNSARIQGAAQMSDASTWFQNGDYPIGPLYIRLNEPGDITLGVRYLEPELLWACWDKFDLVYYGPDAEIPGSDSELLGDANCDGAVDVVDVTTTVDFILMNAEPNSLQFQNTDVNKDQSIDVVDLTSIVQIILGIYQPADTGTTRAPALRLHSDDALLLNGTDIALRNSREYVAFQMDVTLADDAQLRSVQLSQRAADHNVSFSKIASNTYRILAYSLTGNPFTGSGGILLSLNIAGEQKMTVSNILFTDGTAAYTLGLNIATGISTANADTRKAAVYDLQGRRAESTAKGGVYVTDGKKVVIK